MTKNLAFAPIHSPHKNLQLELNFGLLNGNLTQRMNETEIKKNHPFPLDPICDTLYSIVVQNDWKLSTINRTEIKWVQHEIKLLLLPSMHILLVTFNAKILPANLMKGTSCLL